MIRIGALAPGLLPAGRSFLVTDANVARTGDRVSVRMRTVRSAPTPDGMASAVVGFTIDCRARTAELQGVDLYKADGSFGRSMPGEDAVPVSNNDPMQRALFNYICVRGPIDFSHRRRRRSIEEYVGSVIFQFNMYASDESFPVKTL